MLRCPNCNRRVRPDDAFCSTCHAPLEPVSDAGPENGLSDAAHDTTTAGRTAIARFASAAEAGYFAHEIRRRTSIDADVEMSEDFDGLAGHWATRFTLCVPVADAAAARDRLNRLIEAPDGEPAHDEPLPESLHADRTTAEDAGDEAPWTSSEAWRDDRFDPFDEKPPSLPWLPIVLTLTAGSIAFWMLRAGRDAPERRAAAAPAEPDHQDLWERLASPARPWRQPHENGRGIRELRIDAERGVTTIREDADGDGRFERELRVDSVLTKP